MLPLTGMKNRAGPSLQAGVLLCAVLVAVSASKPTVPPAVRCPRHLDCAQERRHFCPPGSSHCGPCLVPLEENKEGRCVARKRRTHFGKMSSLPELDEEIDALSAIIAQQQVKESVPPTQVMPKATSDGPKQKSPSNSTAGRPGTSRPPGVPPHPPTQPAGRSGPLAVPLPSPSKDGLLIVMVAVCIVVGMAALILTAVCLVRLQKDARLAQKVDYPAFSGMVPATSDRTSPGDTKLAQSAQMYHYHHQKQQMLSMEKHKEEDKIPDSGATSDEENEDGDFTVYECPGLAPTGEMEVKNPLFDDSTLHPQRNHK